MINWYDRFTSKESYFKIHEVSSPRKKSRCGSPDCKSKSVVKIILMAKFSGNRIEREFCYVHAKQKGLTKNFGMMFTEEE